MKRNQSVRKMAFLAGALISLPAWARSWSPSVLPDYDLLATAPDHALLSAVIGAILPESDLPGAVALGVPGFVELMLANCFTQDEYDNVQHGLRTTESLALRKFQHPYTSLSLLEQQQILADIEASNDEALRAYYYQIKNLTLQGYTSSEYVITHFFEEEMV